ncbi:MAG: carboxypeptidase regulatory-like domain-containing protein [Acidobacteria bacterium]|nr:carboxypeptidase regulatory-like domain-containing protein [Acidobacteriota bacterium]
MIRRLALVTTLSAFIAPAQETRSMLFGRVLDPTGSAVVNALVVVRNADTGVALSFRTNASGYYEANLLLPGNYEITAEMQGFKKLVRRGITLPVSSRIEITLPLEVGGVTESISVTAEAPLLETSAVTSGRVLDNKTVMELPVMGNSALLLVKLTPGIQYGGVNNYLALHSNVGASDYYVNGRIGGNSWTLDGSPNQGPSRRAAYLPYTDAVSEFKVETTNFDASIGQSSGTAITMISKSGQNDLHGTATWQHWQQRWQGTPFFVKQRYYKNIAAAEAAGNTALANELRNTDKQPTGRSNNWGASGGGPVVIPKLFNGRNRLFWFFTYNAFKDVKVEDAANFNRTVPTLGAREGDFSDMLSLPNSTQYVIHDPATTVADPARSGHVIRTPFAGNVIPKSRFANPAYDKYLSFYPKPNNSPGPGRDPVNNYLASQTPYNWDYYAYSNRIDYQISDKWRMFGRWSVNNFGPEDRADWAYETARGLTLNGLVRNNKGGNVDLVYTQNATTIWNVNLAINQFREGNLRPKLLEFKPSDVGLPAYMDAKAGDLHLLPRMNIDDYSLIGATGYSTWTRYRVGTAKLEMTKIMGNHSLRAAFDNRHMFRTGGGGGNTSGTFAFSRTFTRRGDDDLVPSRNLGHAWAAFILGIPNSISILTPDSYAMHNPYYAWFVQDSWRLTPKLTLNLGLRTEYEMGPTERYDRMVNGYDPTIALPIAAAAEAAYAKNPIPELPASQFKVIGGNRYANTAGSPRNLFKNELMWLPRVGLAYQFDSKTVIRGGYGIFFDTINVLNFGLNQFGYSRSTSSVITTDFGRTWNFPANANPGNGKSPLVDPFPVRADGTRFDVPTRNALGSMAYAGRGFDFTDFDQPHARQQRWRVGFQRQIGKSMVLDMSYAGSYSDRISLQTRINPLAEPYWADGLARNNAIASNLNQNVPNPFYIGNFNQADFSPEVWADMQTNGFYRSRTIRKQQLLRAFPQSTGGNGLRNTFDNGYYTRTDGIEISFEKRFSAGWNFTASYTGLRIREADYLYNEFETAPSERISNDGRPHRFIMTGIWELPFGRGKMLASGVNKPLNMVIGGWQLGSTLEWQPGPLVDWGTTNFYYGPDVNDVANIENRTFDTWFNTANFERDRTKGANSFHRRVFPTRLDGLRRDHTLQWNANLAKNFHITERVNFQARLDALNVLNRSQMNNPVTDPFRTDFGRVVSQTSATNRWLQVQARITF